MQDLTKNKTITKTITAIVLVIVVAVLTVFILSLLHPKSSQDTDNKQPSLTAKNIIDQYKTKAIQGNQYTAGGDPLLGSSIITQAKDDTYSVATNTSTYVAFQRVDLKQIDNDATVIDQSSTFLEGLGLKMTNSLTLSNKIYKLFKNNTTICQIGSAKGVGVSPASFGLGCVATSDTDKTTAQTKKLLALYTESAPLIAFTSTTTLTIDSEGQTFTILYLHKQDSQSTASSLLFLTKDDQQTYLGMRSTTGNNAAAVNSPALIQSLTDTQYGKILTGILEKY